MSSKQNVLSATLPNTPLVDPKTGMLDHAWQVWFRGLRVAANGFNVQGTIVAPISPTAPIAVRGIPLGTLLQHLTDAGLLDTTDSILVDGTGRPLTGGKAAYLALVTSGPTAGQVLAWNGTAWVPTSLAAGGVTQIVAGANINITPVSGTGVVTVNATGGSGLPVANPVFTGVMTGPHYEGNGATPAIALGGSAGVGATVGIAGTDTCGDITFTPGTGSGTGSALFTVTLTAAFSKVPRPLMFPANQAAAAIAANIYGAAVTDFQHWAMFSNVGGLIVAPCDWTYQVMA